MLDEQLTECWCIKIKVFKYICMLHYTFSIYAGTRKCKSSAESLVHAGYFLSLSKLMHPFRFVLPFSSS